MIRSKPPAPSPFYQAIERALPAPHERKRAASASTFFLECAAEDADDFAPAATVTWKDTGTELVITECDLEGVVVLVSGNALRSLGLRAFPPAQLDLARCRLRCAHGCMLALESTTLAHPKHGRLH